ncbi:MAG: hybrid sensor histidine kinase/response regulator [Spirochaetota bacterium]
MQTKQNKERILIIDDTPSNIKLLAALLDDKGYEVSASLDGQQAVQIISHIKPDLILLDIMMPGLDGYEVCKILKEDTTNREIPVIFLTAKSESTDIVKAFQIGAADYIAKPFSSSELLARVRTHILLSKQKKQLAESNFQRERLLHTLCHDLNNTFTSLQLSLDIVHEYKQDLVREAERMDRVVKNGINLIKMVRDMEVAHEKPNALQLDYFSAKDMLQHAFEIIDKKRQVKNITVEKHFTENFSIYVERVSFINSVVCNILSNAFKFSYENSTVEVQTKIVDGYGCIIVRDYGIGIPMDILQEIFNLSKATNRLGTNKEEGTGFGMPIVKRYMDLYQGNIQITSQEEDTDSNRKGTTVTLQFLYN